MDGNQLHLKANMPPEESKNRVWDAIKSVDASFADLKHDIEVGSGGASKTSQSGSAGGNRYTVQPDLRKFKSARLVQFRPRRRFLSLP